MSSPQSDSFQILSENRLTLKLFNIYNNSDGFRLGLINISNGFYFILIILPSIIGIFALVHKSIDFSLDFEQRSTSIDVGIGTMQMFFIYLTLIANKSTIIRTIDRLQFVINESKCKILNKNLTPDESNNSKINSGCAKSNGNCAIYHKFENQNSKIVISFWRTIIAIWISIFLLPLLIPMITFTFGYPSKDVWFLPIESR